MAADGSSMEKLKANIASCKS